LAPLRPLPYREVKRKLEAAGFTETGQRGSHVKFVRPTDEGVRTAIVPRHREITVGTLRSILRQAGISPDEFERL
jgi:predicted RNA binding protein YcfA (HicA-like mRNA interferase family)